ncbi:MAG: hypothetical protein OXD32_00405 [Endozoicomonadaceae bacterium]|nr:hypothetical protein [Endozoicomonadaceae bacterium]MCY4328903.1 hypothetical protein [Endozoicomonadaceae bacterium]
MDGGNSPIQKFQSQMQTLTSRILDQASAQDQELKAQQKQLRQPQSPEEHILQQNAQHLNEASGASGKPKLNRKIPLPSLMMAIMVARAELLQIGLQNAVGEIQDKNNQLKELNHIMSRARQAKKGSGDGGKKTGVPDDVKKYFKDNDVPGFKDDKLNSGDWDLAIENLKARSESLTSTSQLQMTKLQSLTGKYNQTNEMLSQWMSKNFRGGDSIIKNI